jgi:hypothetical protein
MTFHLKRHITAAVDALRRDPRPSCLSDFLLGLQCDPFFADDSLGRPEEGSGVVILAGVSERRLEKLRGDLEGSSLPHEYVLPYGIVLAGLDRAARAASQHRDRDVWLGGADPKLVQAARHSLTDAMDFALQEESQKLSQSYSRVAGDSAFQCFFMGVSFAQCNHRFEVSVWLDRGRYQTNLLRLLFVMGILAWPDRQAHRLTSKMAPRILELTEENFGRPMAEVLRNFAAV